MAQLKCEQCGSTEFAIQDGMYVCQYCGGRIPISADQAENIRAAASAAAGNPGEVHVHVTVDENRTSDTQVVVLKSPKSWGLTLVLSFFFGALGIHRFYTGKIGTGVIWLLTGGLFVIGWVVDFLMVLFGRFKDKQGRPIKRR